MDGETITKAAGDITALRTLGASISPPLRKKPLIGTFGLDVIGGGLLGLIELTSTGGLFVQNKKNKKGKGRKKHPVYNSSPLWSY